ncbi:MAG: MFS transporter [Acidobacteria bacterium]|nr:MFS transporter [Acidobacteriota bacterium]
MSFSQRMQEIRTGFEPAFWVANGTELFERLSYYGVQAVLAVYLHENLQFSETTTGDLIGYFGLIVWFLPILGGTLADRFGFRKSLAFAYFVLALGYFLLGSLNAPWMGPLRDSVSLTRMVLLIMIVPAIGPAIVKPCVVGTTARASHENVRSLGYSIYYTIVNIGGTFGPLMAFAVRRSIGIENVFRVCSASVFLMAIATLLFYREPSRSGDAKVASVVTALKNMLIVVTNLRFVAFLLIFSGFYAIFWQEFIALPLYIRGYVNPQSDVDLLLTVDPLAVILFQIVISYVTRKIPTFPAITIGILISSFAWVILAVSELTWQINTTLRIGSWELPIQGFPPVAALALFTLAVGEMVLSPRFYEYVSRLAPPGQQGTFMGFAFLPVGIGFFVAGAVGGRAVHYFGDVLHQPRQLWWLIAGMGFVTVALMWAYNRIVKPSTTEPATE